MGFFHICDYFYLVVQGSAAVWGLVVFLAVVWVLVAFLALFRDVFIDMR